jgi:ubiquinone/menaquinone biosynthesis C-methylase UbiE
MALADLFAQNVIVRWLTGNRRRYDLAVSMVGVKLGERVLQVGGDDPGLLAALAAKVGFTGRACAVDAGTEAAERARVAAERAGVLVETFTARYEHLPFDPASFDVVVIRPGGSLGSAETLAHAAQAATRVLRPGGRCLVVAGGGRGKVTASDAERFIQIAGAAGLRGARVLAHRDGWLFVEAMKAVAV